MFANDKWSRPFRELHDALLAMQLTCILQCFIIVLEPFHHHSVHALCVFNLYIEVSDKVTRKVILCQSKEKLMFIDGIGMVNQHVNKAHIAFSVELNRLNRVAIVEHFTASFPYICHVKLSPMQGLSSLYTIDYHARHLAKSAFWMRG